MSALRKHLCNRAGEAGRTRPAPSPEARLDREQKLSATLIRLGKLNEEAVARIQELQRQTNAPFAKAASRLGLLTRDDFETALGVQNGTIRVHEGEGRVPQSAVIVRRPASKEAEQFRALRTRLMTSIDAEKLGLFAVASSGAGREADHVAVNLAASFAQIGRKTLIVDADLRKARLAKQFKIAPGPGLREILSGEGDIRDAIRPTMIANLSVLTSGEMEPAAHALLSNNTLELTFDYLRCAYDIVIVLSAPFGAIADAQFVWSAAGAAFVVTRRNKDKLVDLKSLNAALRSVDASIIGAALAG